MENDSCNNIFYIQLKEDDKLDENLIDFLKKQNFNIICGKNPVDYLQNIINENKNNVLCQQVTNDSSIDNIKDINESDKKKFDFVDVNENLSNFKPNVLFIIKDFECEQFQKIILYTKSVLGLNALKYYCKENINIPTYIRPIHNFCMKNLYICFANLSQRNIALRYISLIRYMGASTRKDLNTSRITHLVSNKSSGNKYRIAITCGLPIMNFSWIDYAWENRFIENFNASDHNVIEKFKLQPFSMLYLAFLNFSETDLNEMKDLTRKNGGEIVSLEDKRCTHIVIDAILGDTVELSADLSTINKNVFIVYKEWFWASLEIAGRADEKLINHLYPVPLLKFDTNQSVSLSDRNLSYDILSPTLDFSSDSLLGDSGFNQSKNNIDVSDFKSFSKRRKIFMELVQTEKNYLEVLRIIINIFYKPLEEPSTNKSLIDNTERKIIFGNLPPILEIHDNIYNDLEKLVENWDENCNIGNVFIKYSGALLKAYPLFINYFESTKETLKSCDEKYPRFHAFLKKCQSRPECKRQSLSELLIRPVQRLPSIILLLADLLKNTDKSFSDNKNLKLAIEKIKEILMHINEDKRKTEGQIAMFDIINDIEECPASLLSANRHFICKSDAKLILKSENKAQPLKGYLLTLFLFNDVLEICKKRSKRSESFNLKSNKTTSSSSFKQTIRKSYKHIDTLPLDYIKIIYNFPLIDDLYNALTIVTHPTLFGTSRTYRTYPFVLEDKELKPEIFLENLNQQLIDTSVFVKGTLCKILEIDFEYADQLADKLNKSNFGFAKTKEKITRAFSIKKPSTSNLLNTSMTNISGLFTPPRISNSEVSSPTPRRLSRAFSSFMNIGSPILSSRRQMSITSLNNLHESVNDDQFSCPTTPAPKKKRCINAIN